MEAFRYSYLFMDLGFLIVWLILFIGRRDVRKEMLFISIPLGLMAMVLAIPYTRDWWAPITIRENLPSIEDFLFGFGIGGIAAVSYEDIFGKIVRPNRNSKQFDRLIFIQWILLIVTVIIAFLVLHFIVNLNTFWATNIVIAIGIIYFIMTRPDLLLDSVTSGFLLVIVSALVYTITEAITPGWVQAFWKFENTPNIVWFNVPIDDIVFYFIFGMAVGPMYEYLYQGRLEQYRS